MRLTLQHIYAAFPDNGTCIRFLVHQRWRAGDLQCLRCGERALQRFDQGGGYVCTQCAAAFPASSFSVFHNPLVSYQKWFLVLLRCHWSVSHGERPDARELASEIDLNDVMARRMIRVATKALSEQDSTTVALVQALEDRLGGR